MIAVLSRDFNPVHFEPRFAEVKGFRQTVCHGLLVGGMLTEIGGQIGWLAAGMDFRFRKPVYRGDTITCRLVIETLESNGWAHAGAVFHNQDGQLVLEARLTGIVPGTEEQKVLSAMLAEGDPTNGLAKRSDRE